VKLWAQANIQGRCQLVAQKLRTSRRVLAPHRAIPEQHRLMIQFATRPARVRQAPALRPRHLDCEHGRSTVAAVHQAMVHDFQLRPASVPRGTRHRHRHPSPSRPTRRDWSKRKCTSACQVRSVPPRHATHHRPTAMAIAADSRARRLSRQLPRRCRPPALSGRRRRWCGAPSASSGTAGLGENRDGKRAGLQGGRLRNLK